MEDKLIDNELNQLPKDVMLEIMGWWEKKRLLFNLIISGIVVLCVGAFLFEDSDGIEAVFNRSFLIQSILYFIFINICYSLGWALQLLGYYYFNTQYDSKALDYTLFIIGTLFTSYVTYAGYLEFLMYW
ncbi:MAG: hypothetical protein AB8B56_06600 [Crocinitomicaceae bacterium]